MPRYYEAAFQKELERSDVGLRGMDAQRMHAVSRKLAFDPREQRGADT